MKSVAAHFPYSARTYTYATKLDLTVGQRLLTKAPKGWAYVTVADVHKTPQFDAEAKFEYKELKHPIEVTLVEDKHIARATTPFGMHSGFGPTEDIALLELVKQVNTLDS